MWRPAAQTTPVEHWNWEAAAGGDSGALAGQGWQAAGLAAAAAGWNVLAGHGSHCAAAVAFCQ